MPSVKARFFKLSILNALAIVVFCSCQSYQVQAPAIDHDSSEFTAKPNQQITRVSSPELLDIKELKKITHSVQGSNKLQKLFTTPFLSNKHYYNNGMPGFRVYEDLGPAVRISSWNIEKSLQVGEIAQVLVSERDFQSKLKQSVLRDASRMNRVLRQRRILSESDVFILQEMDLSHSRSDYLFAAQHLAKKLKMNFAYAPQQLEIEPIYSSRGSGDDKTLRNYQGLFGSAVLSKFPIKRTEIFQLKTQPYDWYEGEFKKADLVEHSRRYASRALFHFYPVRELKVGGRGFMRVDLHVPKVPEDTITIINVHLEIKTTPQARAFQLAEILQYVQSIKNPVILAGDFNSSPYDVSATSFVRVITRGVKNPTNLFSVGMAAAEISGAGPIQRVVNYGKNFKDPLAHHVPILLPNRSKSMFELIRDFRFDDGGAFDFRGDKKRSTYAVNGVLSNSNQRNPYKGFTYTFKVPRPIGPFGRERLDWIFVKSLLKSPYDSKGPYRLAPHFGETLSRLNRDAKEPFSDHDPISVLLPIREPDR